MESYISSWEKTDPIKELIQMARGIPEENMIDLFTSLLLKNNDGDDEFRKARKANCKGEEKFGTFTEIMNEIYSGNEQKSFQTMASAVKQEIESDKPKEMYNAKIVVWSGTIKQAQLIDGNDKKNYTLSFKNYPKGKFKIGDLIKVEKIQKNNKVIGLIFINKQ